MIKSDHKETVIAGKGIDILCELSSIFSTVRDESPETLAGVIAGWSDILKKDMPNLDKPNFIAATKFTEEWIKANEVQ